MKTCYLAKNELSSMKTNYQAWKRTIWHKNVQYSKNTWYQANKRDLHELNNINKQSGDHTRGIALYDMNLKLFSLLLHVIVNWNFVE